ncbi:tetratricopeptide repeat protein [Francisellaceae bacterium]|nr:tetratricopeptide repeat protein [Francisellaceae bacterium]
MIKKLLLPAFVSISVLCIQPQAFAYRPWFVEEYKQFKLFALIDRANRLIKNKEFSQAKPYLLYALKVDPDDIEVNKMLLQISLKQEDYKQAKLYSKKLIKLDPKNSDEYIYTAVSYEHLNNPKAELKYLKKAEDIDPNVAYKVPFILQLAYSYLALGNRSAAQTQLDKIPAYIQDPKLLLQISELSYDLRDRNRFEETFQRVSPSNKLFSRKEQATYWFLNAEYQDIIGNTNAASNSFIRALEIYPNDRMYAAFGYHLMHLEKYEDAKECFLDAHMLNPENASYLAALSFVYLKLDKPKIAIEELNLAISKNPNDISLYESLGYAEVQNHNNKEAGKAFQKALSLYPPETLETRDQREAHEKTKMSFQSVEKEWNVFFSDSVRLDNSNFSPSDSLLPYSSYSGNGGLAFYYEPTQLQNTEYGSLQFVGGALWSNENQSVVPVWSLIQGRFGFRYQPFNEYQAYFSVQEVIGFSSQVSQDLLVDISFGDIIGLSWDENEDYWFYHNLFASASWFFIAQQDYLVANYDFGEIFKVTPFGINSGILPYLSLGGLANDQETRIDGGIGLAYYVWNRNTYYDTLSIYQKFGVEVRQKFAGNTQDTHTVRVYYQVMF